MLLEDQHPHNKQITVALLGKPNAGKSTLVNYLLGFDLTIVSSKPQTTRNHYQCVFTVDRTEIVLVDTPGVHSSVKELNIRMNGQAQFGADGVDVNLLLLDLSYDVVSDCKNFMKDFDTGLSKTWIIFTKSDKVDKEKLAAKDFDGFMRQIQEIIPTAEKHFVLSGLEGDNVHHLTGALCDEAAPGPHLYPDGEVSNKTERFFASEYIREQAFNILNEELPYEMAVIIDEYYDAKNKGESKIDAKVSASILVNRQSQRAIVVGSKGSVIKEIGTNARKKIESMIGGRVHLNLHVKVSPKWFRNNFVLDELGLPRTQKSNRVWRKK
jgi:GTP-binding protein Era